MIGFLSDKGYDVFHQPEVYVQNVVASTYVKQKLNLNAIAIGFDLENVEYEPEQFPGLVYRLGDPHVVTLMFSSGKVVITGGKCPEDCIEGMDAVYERLYKLGLVDNG
jgi:transcription initiation factor TFIID TATA-box-binding protein